MRVHYSEKCGGILLIVLEVKGHIHFGHCDLDADLVYDVDVRH